MPGHVGQPAGTIDMHPMQLSTNAYPRLISMLLRADQQFLDNLCDGRREFLCGLLHPPEQGPFGQLASVQVYQQFTGALCGDKLILLPVDRQRLHARTVLACSHDLCRKRPAADVLTLRARDLLDLMLADL